MSTVHALFSSAKLHLTRVCSWQSWLILVLAASLGPKVALNVSRFYGEIGSTKTASANAGEAVGVASSGGRRIDPHIDFNATDSTSFLVTWGGEATGSVVVINVTAEDAKRYSGPLTLLHVLGLHASNPAHVLTSVVSAAHRVGRLQLHVLGAVKDLEPAMDWASLLVGPLAATGRQLVAAFGLPVTPFASINVSMVFCGHAVPGSPGGRPGPAGYREHFRTKPCGEPLQGGMPMLAITYHPGLAKYPMSWWPTLRSLHHRGVPLIVVDYGDTRLLSYQHRSGIAREFDGHSWHLPGTWTFVRARNETVRHYRHAGGLGELTSSQEAQEVYVDAEGRVVKVRRMPSSRWQNLTRLLEEDARVRQGLARDTAGLCSDAQGSLYMARSTGFQVRFMAENPFHFCEPDQYPFCQTGRIVGLFEPEPEARLPATPSDVAAPSLFLALAQRAAPCYWQRNRQCIEERAARLVDAHFAGRVANMDTVDTYLNDCWRELGTCCCCRTSARHAAKRAGR